MSGRLGGQRGGTGGGGICFEWANRGTCSRGARCRLNHSRFPGGGRGLRAGYGFPPTRGVAGAVGICNRWQANGTCHFGNRCRFLHVGPDTSVGNTTPHHTSNEADLVRFVQHLNVVPKDRIGDELLKSADLWRKCWQKHHLLDDKHKNTMLEVIAKTPGSSSMEPPHIALLEAVVQRFLETETSPDKGNDPVLTAIKTVADALSRCLDFEWTGPHGQIRDAFSRVIVSAERSLRKQVKEHRHVSTRFMDMLEDIEKPWRIKLATTSVAPLVGK